MASIGLAFSLLLNSTSICLYISTTIKALKKYALLRSRKKASLYCIAVKLFIRVANVSIRFLPFGYLAAILYCEEGH